MNESYTKIASEAGVSLSTVSRVLRGLPGPSSKTRDLVMRVAQRFGHEAGKGRLEILIQTDRRNLRTASLRADPFYGLVFEGVEARARELGLRVGMVRSPHDTHDYGVLHVGHIEEGRLQELLESGLPVVLVDEDQPQTDRVISQNIMGGRQAAEHLLEVVPADLGIALVAGPPGLYSYPRRIQGAVSALEQAERYDPELLFKPYEFVEPGPGLDQRAGRWAAQQIARQVGSIGGAFIYNDPSAIALLDELAVQGVKVPEQVKIVGFDDDALASHARVPLTTVRVDHHAMGEWAVDLLMRRLEAPQRSPVQVAVAAELVVRASSGQTHPPKGVTKP